MGGATPQSADTWRAGVSARADWVAKLDAFLQFNEHNILTHVGTVSRALATAHAEAEFERYEAQQHRLEAAAQSSDLDLLIEATDKLNIQAPRAPGRSKKP